MRVFSFFLLVLLSLNVFSQSLIIQKPLIPEAPPNAEVMAAYMKLQNIGKKDLVINKISSPQFEKVQMHRSIIENNTTKMIAQDSLTIAAGKTVTLQSGGLHLMLTNPKKPLYQNDTVLLLLTQTDGTEHAIEITVKRVNEKDHASHDHH